MILKYGHIFNLESIDTMQFIILLKKKRPVQDQSVSYWQGQDLGLDFSNI